VLYHQGRTALADKKYDDSYRALTQLARLQPDYEDVARLLQQARRSMIDHHYQEGIRLFREEKLPEAIAEWKIVLEMEPRHVNARRNIEQAERLLKGLEERKSR
jgi:cytochrome c-type biogenesis protein CcmH/NrfG